MRPILAAMFLVACGAPATAPTTPASSDPAAAPTGTTGATAATGAAGAATANGATAAAAPAPAPGPAAPVPGPASPRAVGATGHLLIGGGDWGAAGPTLIRRADKSERWMALCQARSDTDGDGKIEIRTGHHGELSGDAMELYLILGGGEGTRIDALASASADGRWVAIVRGTKVELVDSQTGEVFELPGADAASDGRPGASHRAAMFAGNRLLYIRKAGPKAGGNDTLVVHDPATHAEREIEVPGRLWRIDSGGDRLVQIYTIPAGERFPVLHTTLGRGECLGAPMSYGTYGSSGPRPVPRWIDLDAGKEIAADGGEVAVGSTIVRTPSDGALYFDGDQIAPPACKIQLLAVLPSPVRAIAICGEKKQAKIALFGKGLRKDLASIDRDNDHYGRLDRALDPAPGVVCDGGLHCVATATNQAIDLLGGVAEYAWDHTLYVVHATMSSRKHELIDVATGKRAPIKAEDMRFAAGQYLVDDSYNLVDLAAGKVIGKVPDAIRVSTTGRVLRLAKDGGGPLRWSAP